MEEKIIRELKSQASKSKALSFMRFFKTGVGEYAYGDIFIGVSVGDIRKIAKKYKMISLNSISKLIQSPIHEVRFLALIILVEQFRLADENDQERIYQLYLKKTKYINNWDLVDISAHKIIGAYLFLLKNKQKIKILKILANSDNLWERRISIIATWYFIKNSHFDYTLIIAKILLNDEDDLIQKAVGWMLREVGKKDIHQEEYFLKLHYKQMPRTMLRYAIEKFPESKRMAYLKGNI